MSWRLLLNSTKFCLVIARSLEDLEDIDFLAQRVSTVGSLNLLFALAKARENRGALQVACPCRSRRCEHERYPSNGRGWPSHVNSASYQSLLPAVPRPRIFVFMTKTDPHTFSSFYSR